VVRPLSLSLADIKAMKKVEITAIDQDPGNSRGLFQPRVPGIQWGHGAMGNARWTGVLLRDILTQAGVRPGTVQFRFKGAANMVPGAPEYMKSLDFAHAMNGEVIVAFAMNGAAMPMLNGFPLRLVVPGWYGNYWIKALTDIEVLGQDDDNYWMKKSYLIPDTPGADITPGQQGVKMIPINRMVPRSFFTNVKNDSQVKREQTLRGIAFGGDTGVARVLVSVDAGRSWQPARLGSDHGKYSFRQWELPVRFAAAGPQELRVKAVNTAGVAQPERPNWNASGFMRNVIESVSVQVG